MSITGGARWSVAQIYSKRAHLIRREVEEMGYCTFTPTFAKRWISEGKVSSREAALLPGYLIFQTDPQRWGSVAPVEGVIRVLNCDGLASPVRDIEMYRLVVESAMGVHDALEVPAVAEQPVRRRRRRSRPSKKARMRAAARRMAVQGEMEAGT